MSLVKSKEIKSVADSFQLIADLALERCPGYEGIIASYISNVAFSVELYIKCMDATEVEKVVCEIGTAQLTKVFAASALRGHSLGKLFEGLSLSVKNLLESEFRDSKWNLNLHSLSDELNELSDLFIKYRYVFEHKEVYIEHAERIYAISNYFKDVFEKHM